MKQEILVILLLVFAQVILTAQNGKKVCKKAKLFRKNRSYLYKYEGTVENGIKGTSEDSARIRISANVEIDHVSGCEYSMQMKNVKIEESFGKNDEFTLSSGSATASRELEEYALRFIINHGMIEEIRPVLKERKRVLLNIKRGILSALQVKWTKKKIVQETDVSGVCDVNYQVQRNKDGSKNVTKVKDIDNCRNRSMAHSNIESIQYKQMSSIYNGESSCMYLLGRKNEIKKATCSEYYLMKPFSTAFGAGSYTKISQLMKFERVRRIRGERAAYQEFYTTNLLFDHEHEEPIKSQDDKTAVKLLDTLVKQSGKKTLPSTSSIFADFVFAVRLLNEKGLGVMLRKLETCFGAPSCDQMQLKTYWTYFLEALSQCGTTACVNVLGGMIISKKLPETERIDDFIAALNLIQEPSPAMLNTVMGIYKSTQNPTAVLLLGTLMHKLCKHRPFECQGTGPIRSVLREAEFFIIRLLGNDCRTTNKDRNEIIYYTLKAIGNAGRPLQMKHVILDCIRHATSTKISIAALHALRRMPRGNDVTDILRMMIIDRNVDTEKRIESFLLLMKEPIEDDILLSIDMVNDEREAYQIRSFISSYLTSLAKNSNPLKKRMVQILRKSLKKRNMREIKSSSSRFSKVFDKSLFIDIADFGGGVNGYTIFHPESFIPRTAKFGLNAQILGHSVDIMEIKARMEGLEPFVGKIIGEKGLFSKHHLKKIFDIPKDIPKVDPKIRNRRNIYQKHFWDKMKEIDNQVNMKDSVPDMDLTVSLFGHEIRILKLKDIPFFNGDLENFNFLKAMYALTKGKMTTLRRSLLFLEGSYVVPTALGLPLNFQLNGSSVMSLHLDGKVKVSNLILGPKKVNMKGQVLPSVSLDVSGKVTVDAFFTKAGLRLHSTTYASDKIGGEITYQEGKEFDVQIDAPEGTSDLFQYRHEMFHVVGHKEMKITGSKKRTDLKICADELYNSTQYFGVDVCSHLSFPVAYHNPDAPHYPLTGPAYVGFQLRKTDPSLKQFHLKIAQEDDFLKVIFGTPGAVNPRMNRMNLGIMPSGEKGVIGATFGNTNQGLLLQYVFDNKTNGLEAELKSNFSGHNFVISTRFLNETDQSTLDSKMGIEFKIVTSKAKSKSYLYFVDTYEYWGFNWLFDHGKTHIDSEFKVAYNPQTIFMRWNYGKNSLAFHLVPVFPVVSFDMQVNWPPKQLNLTMKADMSKRTVEVLANTTSKSYKAYAGWLRRRGIHELLVRVNNGPVVYEIFNKIDLKNSRKMISGHVILGGKRYGMVVQMGKSLVLVRSDSSSEMIRLGLVQSRFTKGINLAWNLAKRPGRMTLYYKNVGARGTKEICAKTNALRTSGDFCIHFADQGHKRFIQATAIVNQQRANAKFSHIKRIQNDNDGKGRNADIYMLDMKVNRQPVFDTMLVMKSGTRQQGEMLSSLRFAVPKKKFIIDFRMPDYGIFRRPVTTTGSLQLKYATPSGEHRLQLNLGQVRNAQRKTSDIFLEGKFINEKIVGTDLVYFFQKQTTNDMRQMLKFRREVFVVSDRRAYLSEDDLITDESNGNFKLETKVRFGNLSSIKQGERFISEAKKNIKLLKPMLHTLGEFEVNRKLPRVPFYPKRFEVLFQKNHAIFTMDLKSRIVMFNMTLPAAAISVRGEFHQKDSFHFLIDYTNSSSITKRAEILINKADRNGYWEVLIRHPSIKKFIPLLKSVYGSTLQKYHANYLNSIANMSSHFVFSERSKQKIVKIFSNSVQKLIQNGNFSNLMNDIPKEWKSLVRVIWKEISDKALKDLVRNAKDMGDWNGILSNEKSREGIKSFFGNLGDAFTNFLSLELHKTFLNSEKIWNDVEKYMKWLQKSPVLKERIDKGIRKALAIKNVSLATQEKVLSMVNDWFQQDKQTLLALIFLYRNVSNVVNQEIVKTNTVKLLRILRSKLNNLKPEIKLELEKVINEMEKLLVSLKTDPVGSWSHNVDAIVRIFQKSKTSQDYIHEIIVSIAIEESKKAGLPNTIAKVIKRFATNFRYADLFTGVMTHALKELNIAQRYPHLSRKLFMADSKNLLLIGGEIVKDKSIPISVRKTFLRYIETLNVERLVSDLLNMTSLTTEGSDELLDLLKATLKNRNVMKNFDFDSQRNSNVSEHMRKFLFHMLSNANKPLIYSFLQFARQSSNLTDNWKEIFESSLASRNLAEFLEIIYREVVNEFQSSKNVKSILEKLTKDSNVTNIIQRFASLGEAYLKAALNVSYEKDAFAVSKDIIVKYMGDLINIVPYPWQARIYPIAIELITGIETTSKDDLAINTTNVLFSIGERVSKSIFEYVSRNLSADLVNDFYAIKKDFLPKLMVGNEPVTVVMGRMSQLIKDRFRFGLRIAAQVFPVQIKKFESKYFKKQIQFQRIYKDFLKTNLTSAENLAIVQEMVGKLGDRILMELSNATGGFSTGTGVLNLLKFVNGLNMTNMKSASRSLEKMKSMKYSNWSVPVFLSHLRGILKTIGHLKVENQTINELVVPMIVDFKNILPQMIKESKSLEGVIGEFVKNSTEYLRQLRMKLYGIFDGFSKNVRLGFKKRPKVISFISDLTVPVIGTARKMLEMQYTRNSVAERRALVAHLMKFVTQFDRVNLTMDILGLIESSSGRPVEESIQMFLIKGKTVFEDMEKYALKKMNEVAITVLGAQKEMREVLKRMKNFLSNKADQPLHRVAYKSSRHSYSYIKSIIYNSTLRKYLKSELNSLKQYQLITNKFNSILQNASDVTKSSFGMLNPDTVQQWARRAVPSLVQNATDKLADMIIASLNYVNTGRELALRNAFLNNPKNYLSNLPKIVALKIKKALLHVKPKLYAWLSEAERLTKEKILHGRRISTLSIAKLQSVLDKSILELRKLNHYASALDLLGKMGEGENLKNLTSNMKLELKKLQKTVDRYVASQRDSIKGGDVLGFLPKDLMALSKHANVSTSELAARISKDKRKYFDLENELVSKITSSLQKAEILTKKMSEKVKQSFQGRGIKTAGIQNRIEMAVENIRKNLKMIYTGVARHVRVNSDSSILFVVPEIYQFKKNLQDARVQRIHISQSKRPAPGYFQKADKHPSGVPSSRLLPESTIKSKQNSLVFGPVGAGHLVPKSNSSYTFKKNSKFNRNGQMAGMKGFVNSSFGMLQRSLEHVDGMFIRETSKYHTFIDDMDKKFNGLAQSVYVKKFVEPLKRISSIVTIGTPGERLKTVFQRDNVLNKATDTFMPQPGSAVFYGNHILTFDGKHIYLPTSKAKAGCMYLLSRDFRNGAFTFVYRSGSLFMYIGRTTIVLPKNGMVQIGYLQDGRQLYTSNLPAVTPETLVKSFGSMIEITSPMGLKINCDKMKFMCDFIVPGIFHNKTLGLFGTNNAEYADDLRLPNGRIVIDMVSFLNSWELSGDSKCQTLNRGDFPPTCRNKGIMKCERLFSSPSSVLSRAFDAVRPLPYLQACKQEVSKCSSKARSNPPLYCPIVSLYVRKASLFGLDIKYPKECVQCSNENGLLLNSIKLQNRTPSLDMMLIIRDTVHTKKALKNFNDVMMMLHGYLTSINVDTRYSLVGFDGLGHRFNPYIQTGNGKAFGSITDAVEALGKLELKNKVKTLSGLKAIQFAAKLDLRPTSTKIFIVLDTIAFYSGALREMIVTNNLLRSKGIILNAINKYRFKRNIIGKDSFNTRYHLKIPRGEKLRNLFIHTTDDYVPIVKESLGGIMSLRGLTSSGDKWMKAFPISFNQMILKQIENDRKQCKKCFCVPRKEGRGEIRCIATEAETC